MKMIVENKLINGARSKFGFDFVGQDTFSSIFKLFNRSMF